MEREPAELFAAMPPSVAREAVEMSTGNHSPCGRRRRLSSSSTMPGSTTARLRSRSSETRPARWREKSSTMPLFTVCPDCEVPPPRAVRATPSSRATASVASTSAKLRGTTTRAGVTW